MTLSKCVIFTPMWMKSIPLESPALAEFKYMICFHIAALVVEKMTCFMNKTLKKAVMQRTKLKNKYLRNNTTENKLEYKKKRNFCVKLFKNEKKNYYENLDPKR